MNYDEAEARLRFYMTGENYFHDYPQDAKIPDEEIYATVERYLGGGHELCHVPECTQPTPCEVHDHTIEATYVREGGHVVHIWRDPAGNYHRDERFE